MAPAATGRRDLEDPDGIAKSSGRLMVPTEQKIGRKKEEIAGNRCYFSG